MRKVKDNSTIKNWLRGGQIVDHNIRMFRQTAKRVSLKLFLALIKELELITLECFIFSNLLLDSRPGVKTL
jgi:hypothetical protein